jgi:hypothetical protein
MATKTYRSIVAKINKHLTDNSLIYTDHNRWYIGITDDIERRKREHTQKHGDLKCFASYYAYTKDIACSIETYFTKKGTLNALGSRGATDNSRYVYIFKAKPTIID